jgi:O-antigen ligase
MPIILTNIYYYYLNNQISEKNVNLTEISKSILLKNIIREKQEDFSSKRFELWNKTIEISKNNFFIGYGFQADRKLIKDSVHNVYLYSLICGGVISLLLIIFISLRSAWVSFIILINFIFLKKNYNSLDLIPAFLIPLFLLRGILETSYAIYSIDYLFFITCFFINEINFKKKLSI